MTGRAEVHRLQQKVDATFKRASAITDDLELLSDLARYLCVLVSGFLEQAVKELVLEHARKSATPATVQRYVEGRLRGFTNARSGRLVELLGSFDPEWMNDLKGFLVDERKDAVDSVIALRNTISHGKHAGVTMTRIGTYYTRVREVVDYIAGICDPQ
jgi:hypothetical protein